MVAVHGAERQCKNKNLVVTHGAETPQNVYSVDVPFVSTEDARSAAQVYSLLLNSSDVYTEH